MNKSPIAACIQAGRATSTVAQLGRPSRPCESRQWVSLYFFSVEYGAYPEHADSIEDAIKRAREADCAWIFTNFSEAESWLKEEAERYYADANHEKCAAIDRAMEENKRRFPELFGVGE